MNEITIIVPDTAQQIIYFTGTGRVHYFADGAAANDFTLQPIEKAVMIARLRAIADLIEGQV